MAASEAAAAGPTALASGALAAPAAARGAAAASGLWGPPGRLRGSRPRHAAVKQPPAGPAPPAPPARELIQPSVSELSRAVRTNILCTVRGCGKILPNSPALNMHLVKSHRLQPTYPLSLVSQNENEKKAQKLGREVVMVNAEELTLRKPEREQCQFIGHMPVNNVNKEIVDAQCNCRQCPILDGIVNPTIRKDLKTVPKFYCCPIEGCPRGPDRPFSQFSLVKQHFMKMHAEKKHKCSKCSNSYGTEWDLKRHAEDCGKTFQCTCGCPYASRTALQSHIYRTGHEIPAEHRDPPSKKRKMENCLHNQKLSGKTIDSLSNQPTTRPDPQELETSEIKLVTSFEDSCVSNARKQTLTSSAPKYPQKLLLPKPKVALVKLPIMQFSPMPVFVPTADSSAQPVVLGVDHQGSVPGAVHLLPLSIGTLILGLDSEACSLKESLPLSKVGNPVAVEPISTGVQVNLGKSLTNPLQELGSTCQKNSISSINVQTDLSYAMQHFIPSAQWVSPDSSVSSCSQTDLTFGSQVSLPISVHTQTFLPSSKVTSSIAAQTDVFLDACFQSGGISRETQTSGMQNPTNDRVHMNQAVMCGDIFESVHSSYDVSTDSIISSSLVAETVTHGLLPQDHPKTLNQDIEKSAPIINFCAQNSILPSQNMTDNQTQTIDLLSDLENILSSNMPGQTLDNRSLLSDTSTGPDTQLASGPTQNPAIDFDIEEFFSASNIQTQTEESELSTMTTEPVLESLDIETQTDFLLADTSVQSYSCRGNSNFLGLEMFDTQTQTDLNFFLDSSPHLPLGNILKHSSFSMSTDSSDTETQTEGISAAKNMPVLESKVQLNSTETQTMNSGFETLGSLFFTSNETQTAMDDFLLADLAWNTMESQFSSVETQTCAELHTVSNF